MEEQNTTSAPTPESILEPTQPAAPVQLTEKKTGLLLPVILGMLVLGLIGGSIYFFYFREDNTAPEKNAIIEKTEVTEDNRTEEVNTPALPAISGCAAFPAKLEACEAFSCEFKHPLTGEMMTREIIGLKDGKCEYVEEMPNGGQMKCMFTADSKKSVAELHRNPSTEGAENPLEEATNRGECVISGYGKEAPTPAATTPDEPDDRFSVNWEEFKEGDQDKYWELEAKLSNQQDKMIVIQYDAISKGDNPYYITNLLRPPIRKEPLLFMVRPKKEPDAPEKIMLSILAYECEKMPNETELCDESYGMVTQDDTLRDREKAGDPIKPTRIINKYFDFSSVEEPPIEITEEEYNAAS